ncbi:MAG: AAA family ATPase [Zoogloeaceae bacterium]|nr:AAA family ATPase [Zoogloeaceae bacterium]
MRILAIRFKNLNSLAGEWSIDLTHPAYTDEGIFAIVGPTGAGKTTLLDAICLALHGRTPRLERVNKSENEIMSRHTGECFAEVVFETRQGRFRCHWSQHRAHRKAAGELQPPRHEIADADTGRLLASKIADVARLVEERTGMDFDRFTRSMLLAQGDFAAFLLAAADARAPILEQITGTKIYSQISIWVFERRGEEKKKLELLNAELAGCVLPTAEEDAALKTALDQKNQASQENLTSLARCKTAIGWRSALLELDAALVALEQREKALALRQAAFAPMQEKLAAAARALELAAEYGGLEALRREEKTGQQALRVCRESLPQEEAMAQTAEKRMREAAAALATARTTQQDAQAAIRQARAFDQQIAEQQASIHIFQKTLAERAAALAAQNSRQDQDKRELARQLAARATLAEQMETTRADAALVATLADLSSRCARLKELNQQRRQKQTEQANTTQAVQEATRAWEKQSRQLDKIAQDLQAAQNRLQTLTAAQDERLAHATLADWRKRQLALLAQKNFVARAEEAARARAQAQAARQEFALRKTALATEASMLGTRRAMQAERHSALEKEKELLETQLTLLQNIADLSEARHLLADGEPCPLCGATMHPFAHEHQPQPDETRQRLDQVSAAWKAAGQALLDIRLQEARIGKDLEQAAADEKAADEKSTAAQRDLAAILADDASFPAPAFALADPGLEAKLRELDMTIAQQCSHVSSIIEAAETADKALSGQRLDVDKLREAASRAGHDAQAARFTRDTLEHRLTALGEETESLLAQETAQFNRLRDEMGHAADGLAAIDELDETLARLTARRDAWLARQAEKTALDQQIAILEQKTAQQSSAVKEAERDLHHQGTRLETMQTEWQKLRAERQAHFGDKHPDKEETRLFKAVETADKALEATRIQRDAAAVALTRLKAKIAELEDSAARRAAPWQAAETAFVARLQQTGFADEAHYRAAILPEETRKHLENESRQLASEAAEIGARIREKRARRETERQKEITLETLETLQTTEAALSTQREALQQEIGAIRQKLEDGEAVRKEQAGRLAALARQKSEYQRWQALHELIGSENGKKYRNFAQGLTFDRLIGEANRQLRKMTRRYLLVRNQAQALELDVFDNDQAGEIRSTRNLSGGECFIVSLALALGLSRMASKNVSVDSLFLDEGFGTLDEETLETALEALSNLEREGKLIGIISHVPALNERIPVQIRVTPRSGGNSRIDGPGIDGG